MKRKEPRASRSEWEYAKGLSGVYAVTMPTAFAVKIGWSSDIARRMQQYVTALPFMPVLVAHIPTDAPATERKAQRDLRKYLLHGEWFLWCDEVRGYLEKNFVCTVAVNDDMVRSLPIRSHAYEDDCTETVSLLDSLDRAYNGVDARTRDFICRGCGASGEGPLTLDDFARLASGSATGVIAGTWRSVRARLARKMRWLGDHRTAAMIHSGDGTLYVDIAQPSPPALNQSN